MNVNAIAELLGVTYSAASRLTERLVENGILDEATGNARNRVFRYSRYVDLFTA